MKEINRYLIPVCLAAVLAACTRVDSPEQPAYDADVIRVGMVSNGRMTTKADPEPAGQAAETVPWLKDVLATGMDMTYLYNDNSRKARLKLEVDAEGNILTSEGGITKYSFKAYDDQANLTGVPAKWMGNGAHTFQGVYIPEGLKQQNPQQDYTDLVRYTAVPPKAEIQATVGLVTIPLQHRLARVLSYVLIEESMNARLKGYDPLNYDPEATMLRFCNVKTLDYVSAQGHPVWKEERKVIPHYLGEETIRVYEHKTTGKLVFPTDDAWESADNDYAANGDNSSYTFTDYVNAPCFDIIVRPTYTVADKAMYDESVITETGENRIVFELTLDNNLVYEKRFAFDLDANDETVVYLRVAPERIDYNSTGARLWIESTFDDDYYGVNNRNGNTLSKAGSGWQRAYTNSTLDVGVTDGHYYDTDAEDDRVQYVSDPRFIELLREATEGGACHGDYFILKNDITIDVSDFDDDFVFTGHLDALDHTITLTGVTPQHDWLFAGMNGTYSTAQESDDSAVWEANVHRENGKWVPASGWRAETVNVRMQGGRLFKEGGVITGYVNNCWNGTVRVTGNTPSIPEY